MPGEYAPQRRDSIRDRLTLFPLQACIGDLLWTWPRLYGFKSAASIRREALLV